MGQLFENFGLKEVAIPINLDKSQYFWSQSIHNCLTIAIIDININVITMDITININVITIIIIDITITIRITIITIIIIDITNRITIITINIASPAKSALRSDRSPVE